MSRSFGTSFRRRPEEIIPILLAAGGSALFLFGTLSWGMNEPQQDPLANEIHGVALALTGEPGVIFAPSAPSWTESSKFQPPAIEPKVPRRTAKVPERLARLQPQPVSETVSETPIPGSTWFHPLKGSRLTSAFGPRRRDFHAGVDLAAPHGTLIRATRGGLVVYAGWRSAYGRMVEIDHGGGLTSRYGHAANLLVREGDRVEAGVPIAEVGATGRATGDHLHFEIRRDGNALNPIPLFSHPG